MAHQGTKFELLYHLLTVLFWKQLKFVLFRSVSEEFKVPDGMVGFSKFLFT